MSILDPQKLASGDLYIRLNTRAPCRSLATTVYGGGMGRATGVLIARVDPEYDCPLPENWARGRLEELGLPPDTIVFLTAADPHQYTHAKGPRGRAEALATVALTHPACPPLATGGEDAPRETRVGAAGTVNLLVAVEASLGDAALVDAFRTASEAKAGFLALTGISCGKSPAWSTVSDATALLQCPGPHEKYAGPATTVGADIAAAVVKALATHPSLRKPPLPWLLKTLTTHTPQELVEAALKALRKAQAPLPPGGEKEARDTLERLLEKTLQDPNALILLTAARLAESSGHLGALPRVDPQSFRFDSRGLIVDELLAWALSSLLGGFKTTLSTIWVDKNKRELGLRDDTVLLDDLASTLVGHLVKEYLEQAHGGK